MQVASVNDMNRGNDWFLLANGKVAGHVQRRQCCMLKAAGADRLAANAEMRQRCSCICRS